MSRLLIAVSVLLIAGCGGPSSTPTHDLSGSLTLNAPTAGDGQFCWGAGGYSDIGAGARVQVNDESGKILGVSSLGAGKRISRKCEFGFTVPKLPDAKFYQIEVSHRGEITYSKQDLQAKGWKIDLTLG